MLVTIQIMSGSSLTKYARQPFPLQPPSLLTCAAPGLWGVGHSVWGSQRGDSGSGGFVEPHPSRASHPRPRDTRITPSLGLSQELSD